MKSEHVCRRCGSRQERTTCGDCETTVCVVCYDRCRRCNKPLCDKHFERSDGRGGICDGCLAVRRDYLAEAYRVFDAQQDAADGAGQEELARVFKRARNILGDLERWEAILERRRSELEMLPDTRADDLTRQLKELQHEEVALHAARRAAEDAAAAKSRFVAQVSHEIRTPMNAVVAMADLIADTGLDSQQRKYVETIRRSGDHLVRIVGDILDYSKLEAGRLSIESVPFDLESTLIDCVEMLAPRAAEKKIPIIFRYAPDASRKLMGDPGRIRQVVMNLLGNAIKFTHTGNVVLFIEQLGYAQSRAVMRITVLDTGIGIPKDKYPAIFEQFDQGGASTYREYGGTGLGLAITNQLVRLMGGQVGLSSREGNGSRFRVTLAMKLAEEQPIKPIPTSVLAGRRVMVADPSKSSAELLASLAQQLGARVTITVDRGKLMERLVEAQEEKDAFDVVWLHHMPPYMDAAALGGAIRISELLPRTMLVGFSSAGTENRRGLFEELGFNAYFHGPCTMSDVCEMLEKANTGFFDVSGEKMVTLSSVQKLDKTLALLDQRDVDFGKYSVLVAEDRPVNQEVAMAVFGSLGCRLTLANDGEEAIRLFESGSYDILFMDCQMPVVDGYEATRRIRRATGAGSRVPIIAMTAEVADGYRERCLQAGMNDYIPKPATRQQIASAMTRWLGAGSSTGQMGSHADGRSASTPAKPSSETEHVLDRDRALDNLGGKSAILQRVTQVFLQSVPGEAAALGSAVVNGHYKEIERLAHSIKTAAASLGGQRVSRVAEQLERAGHTADLGLAQQVIPNFEQEFAALLHELHQVHW